MSKEIRKEDGRLACGDLLVGPRPDDDVLGYAYFQMKRHGLIERIWHVDPPNISEFLNWCNVPGVGIIGCWRMKSDVATIVGFGMVNGIRRTKGLSIGEIGFAFWPGSCSTREKLRLGAMMVQHVFEEYELDSLTGTTPVPNEPAIKFARMLGFAIHGPVEAYTTWGGKPCGAWISQLSRK